MNPIRTERVIHYDNGSERRNSVPCDENCHPIKPEMSPAASDEWDMVLAWFANVGLEHLLDASTLRDHCLAVARGDKASANLL